MPTPYTRVLLDSARITRGDRPAFFVGVTGIMKLDLQFVDPLRSRVRQLFKWLKTKESIGEGFPGPGLGLDQTPIILLSGLAPGADQLVAEVARELDIRIEVPLPFPLEVSQKASSYDGSQTPLGWQGGSPWLDGSILGKDPWYLVRLAGDEEQIPSDTEFDAMKSGDAHKVERYRRYRAVGEFIAIHSDLLIALDDNIPDEDFSTDDLTQCGTDVIVQIKRRGPTPGLLRLPTLVDWADNGPVFHFQARRSGSKSTGSEPPDGQLTILHPFACRSLLGSQHGDPDAEWKKEGEKRLRRIADHLETMNREEDQSGEEKLAGELKSMLPTASIAPFFRRHFSREWWEVHEPSIPNRESVQQAINPTDSRYLKLRDMAAARRRIADFNGHYDGRVKALKSTLLWCAIGLAFTFQFAENWVPAAAVGHGGQGGGAYSWMRPAATILFAGLFLWALWLLYRNRGLLRARWPKWLGNPAPLFERQEDYRAVAEGLRVQFYWTAAGTGESVAASYLQRAHSHLNWIRLATSSLAFPYDVDQVLFKKLTQSDRLNLLKSIGWGWLGRQRHFFGKKEHELDRLRCLLHHAGTFFLGAGIMGVTGSLAHHVFQLDTCVNIVSQLGGGWLAVIALGLATVPWALAQLFAFFGWDGFLRRVQHWLHYSPASFALGLVFGLGMMAWIRGWPLPPADFPSPTRLIGIFKYVSLGIGGVLHATSAWQFLPENIYRYHCMHLLFAQACERYEGIIKQIDPNSSPVEFDARVEKAQRLLVAVGREALNENTDWYVLHRTHPVEMVSPFA